MIFEKYSVVKCPLCGKKSRNMNDVPEGKSICCPHCRQTFPAEHFELFSTMEIDHTKIERQIKNEIEDCVARLKQLTSSIAMPMDEVISMLKN